MKDKIVYSILYSIAYLHALLPFTVLYLLSDILYFNLYYLAGYRKKIVRKNLTNSFPNLPEREIVRYEKDFYHFFCDNIVEIMKILRLSEDEIRKRMRFKNIDLLQPYLDKGDSFIVMLAHYGNWEWVPSFPLWMPKDFYASQIYRKLKNKPFDDFMFLVRSRYGAINVEKKDTYRAVIKNRQAGIQMGVGFISDQKPSPNNQHYWTTFLNQETAVLDGAERIAKQTGFVVVYLDVTRLKRGYHEVEVRLVSDDPKSSPENEISETYIRMLEESILRNPPYWLWTHDRWKHKRPSE